MIELTNILKKVLEPPGPSGFEDEIREVITSILSEWGLKPLEDAMGNVYVEYGEGKGETLMITAHMDEIGLMVTGSDNKGRLYFTPLGGTPVSILESMHVKVKTSKGYIPGIIGIIPPHIRKGETQLKLEDLRIDIGAESEDEIADLGVQPPTPAILEHKYIELRRGEIIAGRPLDDRVGVSLLLALARYLSGLKPSRRIILAWTVQEEIGLKGAYALAHKLNADYMIALDTITCCKPPYTGGYTLGRGPVLRLIDRAYISCMPIARWVISTSKKEGINLQVAAAQGGTDAAAGVHVGTCSTAITVAAENSHSTVEKIYKRDLELTYELLERLTDRFIAEGVKP